MMLEILKVLAQPIIYKHLFCISILGFIDLNPNQLQKDSRVNLEMGEKYSNLADRFAIWRSIRLEVSTCWKWSVYFGTPVVCDIRQDVNCRDGLLFLLWLALIVIFIIFVFHCPYITDVNGSRKQEVNFLKKIISIVGNHPSVLRNNMILIIVSYMFVLVNWAK